MEPQITVKNVELTPTVRQFIEQKLGKLKRHLPNISEYMWKSRRKRPSHRSSTLSFR